MKDLTDLLDKYNQYYYIENHTIISNIIDLTNINLTSLPESIGNLECVEFFLQYNNLTSLPESIYNIKCTHLSLHNNYIQHLPKLNENITSLSIDNFYDLSNLLYLPNLAKLWICDIYYDSERLTELLNKIKHQKVMNDMNKILQTI